MPEGPETKTIADGLSSIVGNQLQNIEVIGGRYSKEPPEGISTIRNLLPLKVMEVGCKGKFIYWKLSNDWTVWNSLSMTGQWGSSREKHSCVGFTFNAKNIFFNDSRHFGSVRFVKGYDRLNEKLDTLGPDMLSAPPSLSTFAEIVKSGKDKTITELLMDQKMICGVGNYIKSEALYSACISPWRKCSSLSFDDVKRLLLALTFIMRESYSCGGATLFTYKSFTGKIGSYSKQFAVYGKVLDPKGRQITKETTADKRSTWWVPAVQP